MPNRDIRTIDILYVEDNPADAVLARQALKDADVKHRLTVLPDGEDALDYLFKRGKWKVGAVRPHLILLDLNLPRIGGRDVLAAIKADDSLSPIPVVILTTSAAQQDILEGYKLGAAVVRKPLTLDQYVHVMRAIDNFWVRTATYSYPPDYHDA